MMKSTFLILNAQCSLFLHNHPSKAADVIVSFNPCKVSHQNNFRFNFVFPFDNYRIRKIEEKRKGDAKDGLERMKNLIILLHWICIWKTLRNHQSILRMK